ncbi:MAG: type II toxin-antitoxin system VapC family toxin [Polaromonas sp.]
MSQVTRLDASATIAFLQHETGDDVVKQALQTDHCAVRAANQSEVIAKSLDRGIDPQAVKTILAELTYTVIDNTAEDGIQAGWMRSQTRTIGLTLRGRLCMATAQRRKVKILTADRPWLTVAQQMGLTIECIRPDAYRTPVLECVNP